jgi:hypothetical protein
MTIQVLGMPNYDRLVRVSVANLEQDMLIKQNFSLSGITQVKCLICNSLGLVMHQEYVLDQCSKLSSKFFNFLGHEMAEGLR